MMMKVLIIGYGHSTVNESKGIQVNPVNIDPCAKCVTLVKSKADIHWVTLFDTFPVDIDLGLRQEMSRCSSRKSCIN